MIRPVPSSDDAVRRIDTLIQVAMRLAGSAPSGRVALAKTGSAVLPEWLPMPWGETIWAELSAARAAVAADPIPARTIERILQRAWDAKPTDELDSLDTEPVAMTPTSQVHRGVLDGDAVAVKVLRPGLAASVRQDLALLEGLASPLGAAFPGLDPAALIREARERVLDELDLEHEAGSMRRFQRALRGHPAFVVPAAVTRLAGEDVLVSSWIDGTPLSALDARTGSAEVRDGAAARLVTFVIGGLRAGLVHADPDPDDVLVTPDGRLAVLDYGAVATVEPERADAALALVQAFAAADGAALGAALARLGLLAEDRGPEALALAAGVLGELGGEAPTRLDTPALVSARERLEARADGAVELLTAGSLPPRELWPARGTAQLFGTIARVGASGAWRELVLSALRDGWDAAH
jgi:hypothetical protein